MHLRKRLDYSNHVILLSQKKKKNFVELCLKLTCTPNNTEIFLGPKLVYTDSMQHARSYNWAVSQLSVRAVSRLLSVRGVCKRPSGWVEVIESFWVLACLLRDHLLHQTRVQATFSYVSKQKIELIHLELSWSHHRSCLTALPLHMSK